MVVIGQWPYQHVETLYKLHMNLKVISYYFVDMDKLVSADEKVKYQKEGYIIDEDYYTIMGDEMYEYVSLYIRQNFPIPVPDKISILIDKSSNDKYKKSIAEVQGSAALMIVNSQGKSVMEDIGAQWNKSIGVWVVAAEHLQILREQKTKKYDGKIYLRQDPQGILVEVYGDVSQYVNILLKAKGRYDETKDVWLVPMNTVDMIAQIPFNK